jgi:hypothetical protein
MGTSGVVAIEWSNDGVTWTISSLATIAGVFSSNISVAGMWTVPVVGRYFRIRVVTATTAGTTSFAVCQFDDSRQMWFATQAISLAANAATGMAYYSTTTGAASFVSVQSPATPAVTTIKSSAGRLIGFCLTNSAASLRSVKLFNATAPTLGTTSAQFAIDIPAGASINFEMDGGMAFATAMTYSVTAAKGLTDNTSTGLAVSDVTGFFTYA